MSTTTTIQRLESLTIASGAQNSNILRSTAQYGDAVAFGIMSPAVLSETVVIQAHYDPEATGAESDWKTIVDEANVDIGVPPAGKARWYHHMTVFGAFRLRASAAVGADRVFLISKSST